MPVALSTDFKPRVKSFMSGMCEHIVSHHQVGPIPLVHKLPCQLLTEERPYDGYAKRLRGGVVLAVGSIPEQGTPALTKFLSR